MGSVVTDPPENSGQEAKPNPGCLNMAIKTQESQSPQLSSSSYTLASDASLLSGDIDRWIRGNLTPTESTGVQPSRPAVTQRSTLVHSSSLDSNGMWYLMAMVLPLVSANNYSWRCTQGTLLNTAEILFTHVTQACSTIRAQIRRLAQDQVARDIFATAMDIVLVIYAIGFLVLSMYQASIIG